MLAIFASCDSLNIRFTLYRNASNYVGDGMRWSCDLEGGNDEGFIKAEASATSADAAVELAWHRFQKLASGQMEAIQAIANSPRGLDNTADPDDIDRLVDKLEVDHG